MDGLRYAIDHSGITRDENTEYDNRTYYENSGAFGIIAQCMDTHDSNGWIGYKTIRFYHDYDNEEMEKLIKDEIRKRFAKKFRYCDTCEEEILDQIERDYA